jgi:hypothetical protein
MMKNKFTVIVPTRGLSGLYFQQALTFYRKYLQADDVYEFIVITPDVRVEPFLKKWYPEFNWRVISDDEMNVDIKVKPWIRQQFYKLLISMFVKTELYLVVDDDCFLNKRLGYDDIYANEERVKAGGAIATGKKIRYNSEKFSDLGKLGFSSKSWIEGSCKLLNVNVDNFKDKNDLMGVTPQILVVKIVKELLSSLPSGWMDKFIDYSASEYSLYWVYTVTHNYADMYTDKSTHWWYTDENTSLINPNTDLDPQLQCNLTRQIIYNGIRNNAGYFYVLQSHYELKNYYVWRFIHEVC